MVCFNVSNDVKGMIDNEYYYEPISKNLDILKILILLYLVFLGWADKPPPVGNYKTIGKYIFPNGGSKW